MPTEEQRDAFRHALRSAREDAGFSTRKLAGALDLSQSAVWQWEEGRTLPRPEMVTAAERALGVEPGRLSRLLGYVSTEVADRPVASVLEAVDADPRLGDRERTVLRTVYRALVDDDTGNGKATSESVS